MDREDNTHYFNLEYLNYSEPQVKDINAKPSKAFEFDGMTAYVYELEKVWEVHVRIWEDEPEPEPHRVDKMIDYMQHEGVFTENGHQFKVWVLGLKRKNDEVYKVGCLGKISDFQKSRDGRILINLIGLSRFEVIEETK